MIIYIEGVDGTGKTTLKNKLVERLNEITFAYPIKIEPDAEKLISTSPLKPNRIKYSELTTALFNMAVDLNTVFICDRGPLSDIIYRTFDEYPPVISLTSFLVFWERLQQMITVVFCDSDKSEEFMKTRGDGNIVAIEHHKKLRYLYKQLLPLFFPIKYDVAKHDIEQAGIIGLIIDKMWSGREIWMNNMTRDDDCYGICEKEVN